MLPQIPLLNQNYKPLLTITLEKPEPTEQLYTIKDQDTLTSISEATGSSVERLWAKNPSLTNPDVINPGQSLTIPKEDEVLADREMPAIVKTDLPMVLSSATQISPPSGGFSSSGMFDTTGGWCTNYAARRHPVPAWFQNANMWLINARQAGLPTGTTPQVGAIAVAALYTHVSIVEQVDGNRVYVSEQNYEGYGVVSSRWTDISEWQGYIY